MIRHSSSFVISLIVHSILLTSFVYTYQTYFITKKEVSEKKVCIKLNEIIIEKPIKKSLPQPQKKVIKQKPPPPPKIKPIEKKVEIKKSKVVEPVKKVLCKTKPVSQEEQTKVIEKIKEKPEIKKSIEVKPADKPQILKPKDMTKEYVKINTQKISELLQENLYYPRSARKRGITGKIVVKFTLRTDSKVYDIKVIESQSDILSRAAIKTINNLSGKFPKPAREITLHVPIGYSLK